MCQIGKSLSSDPGEILDISFTLVGTIVSIITPVSDVSYRLKATENDDQEEGSYDEDKVEN